MTMTDPAQPSAIPPSARVPEPRPDPLRCREVVELVTDYLEDALAPEDAVRLEGHLAQCDPCVRYVEQVRQTIRAAGVVEPEAVPPDVLDRLLVAYRELRGG
jgi:predicted anti-sigma-YlaC factor YlaD